MSIAAKLKFGWALAALLPLGLAGVSSAQMGGPGFGEHRPPFERAFGGPGGPGGMGRWWNNPAMVEKLKLTDEQRKSMDQIMLQHRETLIDLRGNLEKAELSMEPLLRDDQPNEAKILAQIDKVAQARAELEKANARFLLAIRSKLSPDQWKEMQADRAKFRENPWGQGDRGHRDMRPDGQLRHKALPPPPPPAGPQGELAPGPLPMGPDTAEAPAGGEMQ